MTKNCLGCGKAIEYAEGSPAPSLCSECNAALQQKDAQRITKTAAFIAAIPAFLLAALFGVVLWEWTGREPSIPPIAAVFFGLWGFLTYVVKRLFWKSPR